MNPDTTFTHHRKLRATPGQVFTAFQNPEILAHFWGPRGFTNTFRKFSLESGAEWIHDMHGPDGATYPNRSVFGDVTPERIAMRHLETVHGFDLEFLIQADGAFSRITMNQTFDDVTEFEKVRSYVPRCNKELLDRLEVQLATHFPSELDLVFSRFLDVPAEWVYRGWTDPSMIVQWFTPPPYKTLSAEMDVRPGGKSHITMQAPDGTVIPNSGVYLEVIPNQRLVITDAFTEAWIPSPKPFVTIDLHFEDLGGKTKYTAIVHHWSLTDRQDHERMGFQSGWGTATDQLLTLIQSKL